MKEGKAYKYAVWCSTEQEGKVPKYVKKQAESWLHIADGNDEDAYVDEQEYEKICKLLKLMVHPDLRCSIYDGLEDYAWLMIVAGLCTYCRNSEQRSRFYVTILLEIARKNFKTFNSAVIFILLMLTEPDFSRFFSVAPDLQLSSELKNAIRKIIKVSPALYDEDEPAFKVLRSQIICLLNENEYTPLAYSQDGMDGKLANAYLADEAGALDDYPVEAMRSSQITLFNKLGIIISTQYPNDNNVMIDEIDIAKKTLDGLLDDRRYFALLYEPDDDLKQGEAWQTDDRAIYQSNPVAVSHQYIFDEIKKKRTLAVLYENKRENYLCKHNNILYKGLGVEGYIDIQKVKLCRIQPDPQWWNGRQVWVGVDLSQTDDNTAVAMVTEDNGYIYARVMGFIPKEKINIKTQKEHVDYQRMISKGECIACGEEVIDYSVVENYVIHLLEEEYGVIVEQVGYDRYNAISSVQKMEAEGLECVEIKQHSSVLHQPTKWLKELILQQAFRYEENRLLEINFQNARCTEDTNLNKFEETLVATGGNKKGFIKSPRRLSQQAINSLKEAWRNLYSNNTESVVILNEGLDFQEASNTSVEMQLNENKKTNGDEICKVIGIPPSLLSGNAGEQDEKNFIKYELSNLLAEFRTALNRAMLLESEKQMYFFDFDISELIKGDIDKRYNAYSVGIEKGFLQTDEVRKKENMPPLGMKFIKLGLQDGLYDPESNKVIVLNTSKTLDLTKIKEGGDDPGE